MSLHYQYEGAKNLNKKINNILKEYLALADVAQLVEHCPTHQNVTSSFLVIAHALVVGLIPRKGCAGDSLSVSLAHQYFSLPFLSLLKNQ